MKKEARGMMKLDREYNVQRRDTFSALSILDSVFGQLNTPDTQRQAAGLTDVDIDRRLYSLSRQKVAVVQTSWRLNTMEMIVQCVNAQQVEHFSFSIGKWQTHTMQNFLPYFYRLLFSNSFEKRIEDGQTLIFFHVVVAKSKKKKKAFFGCSPSQYSMRVRQL